MIGYNVETLKIKLTLDFAQQAAVLNVWNNLIYSNQMLPQNVEYIKDQLEHVEHQYNCVKIEDYLNVLGFNYERKGLNLTLTYFDGPESCQRFFFEAISQIISPGSYVTWKGEDGIVFGWFFNGKLIDYDSKDELNTLKKPFELKKKLDKSLPNKPLVTKKSKL